MSVQMQISDYLAAQPNRKRHDMWLADRKYLAETCGGALGKASVTGYCIRFRTLGNINLPVLEAAIRDAIARTGT